MELSLLSILGMLSTLLLIAGVGVYAGKKVSSAQDFTSGNKDGARQKYCCGCGPYALFGRRGKKNSRLQNLCFGGRRNV